MMEKIITYFLKFKCDTLEIYFKLRKIEYCRWSETIILYGQRLININNSLADLNQRVDRITKKVEILFLDYPDYQEL